MSREAPVAYRWIQRLLRIAVRAFFREVRTEGLDFVPAEGGGLVVSWHPNGLVDPGLVLTQLPRPVVFGARHGLFRYPGLGTLLRRIGTVPIYRAIDLRGASDEQRRAANRRSLDALAGEIARGSFSALFPEGVSHDDPFVQELKTGAARLYYRARQLQPEGATPPVILPVGLHYDDKQMFRSNALVAFHPPLTLPPELDVTPGPDATDDELRALARGLTDRIEVTLREVVHATDDWTLHHLMHRTRRLVRAERAHRADADPGRTSISERVLGFARVRAGYYAMLQRAPEQVAAIRERVDAYDRDLRAAGLEDYDLDEAPTARLGATVGLVGRAVLLFGVLPPIVAFGTLVNLPTALGLAALAKVAARRLKDEATVKLLVGLVAFPLTWLLLGALVYLGHGPAGLPGTSMLVAALASGLAAVGGIVAVRWLRIAGETARAFRVRATRSRLRLSIARLRRQRARLTDDILAVSEGVDLPGDVAPDGRVVPDAAAESG